VHALLVNEPFFKEAFFTEEGFTTVSLIGRNVAPKSFSAQLFYYSSLWGAALNS